MCPLKSRYLSGIVKLKSIYSSLKNLRDKILSYTYIDDGTLDKALENYKKQEIKKGQMLVRPGQTVNQFYYLDAGCIYYYKVKEGEVKVLEFYTEDMFFTDLYAYVQQTTSDSFLVALENSVVYTISKDDVEKLFEASHQLERFGRLSMQDAFIKTFSRVDRLNNLTNEERYLRLLEKRPGLFQRVPQYLIASYLGLTPVGLSKIRKRLSS